MLPYVDRAFLSQRVSLPSVPVGYAAGRKLGIGRVSTQLFGVTPYAVWVAAGDKLTRYQRILGAEQDWTFSGIGFARLPETRVRFGVGYSHGRSVSGEDSPVPQRHVSSLAWGDRGRVEGRLRDCDRCGRDGVGAGGRSTTPSVGGGPPTARCTRRRRRSRRDGRPCAAGRAAFRASRARRCRPISRRGTRGAATASVQRTARPGRETPRPSPSRTEAGRSRPIAGRSCSSSAHHWRYTDGTSSGIAPSGSNRHEALARVTAARAAARRRCRARMSDTKTSAGDVGHIFPPAEFDCGNGACACCASDASLVRGDRTIDSASQMIGA